VAFTEEKMKENSKGRKLALWGAWLQLGPVFGLLGTVVGMIGAFAELANQGSTESADALAENINVALITTAIGIIPALIGLVCLLVALFASEYRAPWFFWFMAIYAALCILVGFPVGTIIGIIILIYIIPRKKEFECEPAAGENASRPTA